jgi:hypothetical protein
MVGLRDLLALSRGRISAALLKDGIGVRGKMHAGAGMVEAGVDVERTVELRSTGQPRAAVPT